MTGPSQVHWPIPSTWAWTHASEVAEVVGGGTPRTNDARFWNGGDIPWITPADLSGYTNVHISHGARFITAAGLASCGARLLPAGTVLMSSRAPIGYAAIASCPVATSQGFKSFVPSKAVLPEYLYYFILGNRRLLLERAGGTTFQEISGGGAAQIALPLPPLAEQRRIVAAIEEHLSRLEAAVAGLRRAQLLLPRFRAMVLADALKRASESSKLGTAILRRIEECAVRAPGALTDGPFGSKLKTEHYTSSGARVIRLQNVGDGHFIDEQAYVSTSHFETLRRHEALAEDVIIAALGNRLPRACLVPHGLGPAIVKADCFRLRPDREVARPRWLEIVLNAEPTRERASLLIKGIGRPRLNLAAVRMLEIPLPDLVTQDRLVADVDQKLSLLESLRRSCDRLLEGSTRMRNAVLAVAFSGRLLPQGTSDEPASTLLARIRAERAATPPTARAPRRRSRSA